MQNLFGQLKEQAGDYIQQNPDQVEGFKNTALGFLKKEVDTVAGNEDPDSNQDGKVSKIEELKYQAATLLKPQLDNLTAGAGAGSEGSTEDDDKPSKPPSGKPSYLTSKKKDDDDDGGSTKDDDEPSSTKPPPGKPSYLISKKKDDDVPEASSEQNE